MLLVVEPSCRLVGLRGQQRCIRARAPHCMHTPPHRPRRGSRPSPHPTMISLYHVTFSARQFAGCQPGTGGRDCKPCQPGTYSLGGQAAVCQQCPAQALCLSMPTPCQMTPPCEVTTGRPTSMCWVPRPEGAACSPDLAGDQAFPVGTPVTHVCRAGTCVLKGSTASGEQSHRKGSSQHACVMISHGDSGLIRQGGHTTHDSRRFCHTRIHMC